MKTVFVVGCSYTNWKDGNCFGESYPALVAKHYPDWHIYDISRGGASNDSMYMQLKCLERAYGPPDKVVVQWTHLRRSAVLLDNDISLKSMQGNGNYTFFEIPNNLLIITAGSLYEKLKHLATYSAVSHKILFRYYSWYLGSNQNIYNTQKEIDLINAMYGKENVLMFSWHNYSFSENEGTIDMPPNFVGSVNDGLGDDQFYKLGIDDSPHYAAEGQLEVYKWLMPHLNKLLT